MKKLLLALALLLVSCTGYVPETAHPVSSKGVVVTDKWGLDGGQSLERIRILKYDRTCYVYHAPYKGGIWCE